MKVSPTVGNVQRRLTQSPYKCPEVEEFLQGGIQTLNERLGKRVHLCVGHRISS
jgi:hypothetical protein